MKKIANISKKDREALIRNTASKMGVHEAVIEKDFWVCFILDYLFNSCQWKNHFIFKGGTSLSKAYNLIQRFSEDIDLILDWRLLGYKLNEPWEERSKNQQNKFNKEADLKTVDFLKNKFLPAVLEDLKSRIKHKFYLEIDESDTQTVKFIYPKIFKDEYILNVIKLEIGALAAWSPSEIRNIKPYISEYYEHLFVQPETTIKTVSPIRTFWEKATILHREAFRAGRKELSRMSRHYYDLNCMLQSTVKEKAINDPKMLEDVAKFKDKFYHSEEAQYCLAKFGTLKLMPPEHNIPTLREDYEHMKKMIFGPKPSFDEILSNISAFEREINSI